MAKRSIKKWISILKVSFKTNLIPIFYLYFFLLHRAITNSSNLPQCRNHSWNLYWCVHHYSFADNRSLPAMLQKPVPSILAFLLVSFSIISPTSCNSLYQCCMLKFTKQCWKYTSWNQFHFCLISLFFLSLYSSRELCVSGNLPV